MRNPGHRHRPAEVSCKWIASVGNCVEIKRRWKVGLLQDFAISHSIYICIYVIKKSLSSDNSGDLTYKFSERQISIVLKQKYIEDRQI